MHRPFLCRSMSQIFLLCFSRSRPLPARPYDMVRHMADDKDFKIDPALVQLSQQRPREIFIQKGNPGYGIQMTSTCAANQPACWPIHTETEWTPLLYASIADEYAELQAGSTDCRKQIVGRISDLYGRGKSTIATALSAFRRST